MHPFYSRSGATPGYYVAPGAAQSGAGNCAAALTQKKPQFSILAVAGGGTAADTKLLR